MFYKYLILALAMVAILWHIFSGLPAFSSSSPPAGSEKNYLPEGSQCLPNPVYENGKSGLTADSLFYYANLARRDNGIPAFKYNSVLGIAARRKADDMAKKRYFSHTGPDGKTAGQWISGESYAAKSTGENLAAGYDSARDIVCDWLASPRHRTNLLNSFFEETGVGIAEGVFEGRKTFYVVEFYGDPAGGKLGFCFTKNLCVNL